MAALSPQDSTADGADVKQAGEANPLDVDWSSVTAAGGEAAKLPAMFTSLQTGSRDAVRYTVMDIARNLVLEETRAVAAPVALPYTFALLEPGQNRPNRALLLQIIGVIGLGAVDDFVPQGIDVAAAKDALDRGTDPTTYPAYKELEAMVPRIYPLLEDHAAAVRAQAAYVLSFFPATRDASTPRLLRLVDRESNAEVRTTGVVAAAMLVRGGTPHDAAWEAEREAFIQTLTEATDKAVEAAESAATLRNRAQFVFNPDAGKTDKHLAAYALSTARCIVGLHRTDDIKLLMSVTTVPQHLLGVPREAESEGESEMPYADPHLHAFTAAVLAQVPVSGPQPADMVFHMAEVLGQVPAEYLDKVVSALLRFAGGTTPSGAPAVPAAWPPYADIDDRFGAAVRALSRLDRVQFASVSPVLAEWKLPTSRKGLNAYMAGKPAAEAAAPTEKTKPRGCLSCFGG